MKEKVSSEKSMVHYDLCSNRARNKGLGVFLVMCTAFLHRKGMTHPCGFPGRPRNGSSVTATTVSRPGDTAQYSCRPGYTLFGDEERVCLESGIWAGRQPICELNLVLEKPALMSAQLWNYKPGLAVDGNVETCSFTPRTSEQRWWQVDLTAEQHIGSVALVISQDSYHELTIFIIELVSRSEALYKPCVHFKGRFPNSRMLFSCNKGKGHKGRYVYIRDDRKDHDYFGLCEVEVFAYRDNTACGDPEESVGSKILVVGDTAIYSCLPGYTLVDSPNRTCEQGGHWTGHSPQCRAISCGDPPKIDHAEIDLVNHSTTWNSLAMYSCKAGYYFPQGPLWSVQCLENGMWEPVNLTCIADDDSRHQLAVKSRDEGRRNSDVKTSLGSTHTVVSAGIISSVLITVILAVGIILIRRHQAKNRYNSTPQSSSNDLISPNSKNTQNETPLSPPIEQPESTVLYTVVETTSRELMDNVTQESSLFVQPPPPPPKEVVKPCVSPEILALYSQIDLSKKKIKVGDPGSQRESCKISKECDCARYNLAEDLARYSIDGSPGRQQMQPMLPIPVPVPQVCLLPASKHQLLQTMTSDKL